MVNRDITRVDVVTQRLGEARENQGVGEMQLLLNERKRDRSSAAVCRREEEVLPDCP